MRTKILLAAMSLVAGCMCGPTGESAATPQAPRRLKVLMIGNSFSICVLKEMPKVASSLGLELDLCSLYIGGCSLAKHMDNVRAADKDPSSAPYKLDWNYASVADQASAPAASAVLKTSAAGSHSTNIQKALAADRWDIVTVQQASHDSWRPETYEPHGSELVATVRRLAPQAKVWVQQTWSYTPWDGRLAKWGISPDEMFEKLRSAYADFAARNALGVIPMGEAVQRYRRELPVVYGEHSNDDDVCGSLTFKQKDGRWEAKGDPFHLNARGNYLQALVWTASLFGADVTQSDYLPDALKDRPERASLMRRVAAGLR